MRSYRDLDVWKMAVRLAKELYRMTATFPREEIYGLSAQIRKSAVSIPSNIAEGASRQTRKEFIQFLYIACGSANELDTQLEIAGGVELPGMGELGAVQEEVRRVTMMLRGLIRSLQQGEP